MNEDPDAFERNHGENIRLMRMRAKQCRNEGDNDTAFRIDAIADQWEAIYEKMKGGDAE